MVAMLIGTAAMAQQPVDVHSHIVTPEYLDALGRHGALMEDGYPLPSWSAEKHLQFMAQAGIDWSVLSMPSPHPYFGNVKESQKIIRSINEAAAKTKAKYPEKFKFCASLPLPDVESAIAEAIYALDTLHADGIKLASNSRGQYLGDAALDPLMEILNARSAVVIIHPHRPTPQQEGVFSSGPTFVYEYPAETTRAVINMISRNVMVRYPNIKWVVPHSGSFLPTAIPRLRAAYPLLISKGIAKAVDLEKNLARLYYDLAGGPTPEMVKMLLTITTPDHIMYGSDYGFVPDEALINVLKRMKANFAADADLAPYVEMFFRRNAAALFEKSDGGAEK